MLFLSLVVETRCVLLDEAYYCAVGLDLFPRLLQRDRRSFQPRLQTSWVRASPDPKAK